MPSQHLSFIVPLFNHVEESKVMLKTLIATIPENTHYEIILINDASTDATKDWLSTLQLPYVKIIHNETNQGFAKTNNIAVRQASGEVFARFGIAHHK